ncbi:mycofactocin biosynthesis peptidyl-dipeptidase MftE [Streptomyces sp. NPDC051572]|uniref:mycofactocin biosynthesis peptidyl-dipeptidase MftE n=1 Tax=unclassified Streptomyces TaxID=2593676 RepID=UPI00344D09BB
MSPMTHGLAWPDVPQSAVVLVPVGSFEQHGPHLPMHTDTTIAAAVAEHAARRLDAETSTGRHLAAPAIPYGASGEHQDFPGTMSIGSAALETVLVELVRSLSTWAGRVVFVSGHGGNLDGLGSAVTRLAAEGHDVSWVPCSIPGGDAHAGHTETSLMLHLAHSEVDMSRAVRGNCADLHDLLPAMVAGGVRPVSASGVLGDPRGACARTGAAILRTMTDDVVARIRCGRPDARGALLPAEAAWART